MIIQRDARCSYSREEERANSNKQHDAHILVLLLHLGVIPSQSQVSVSRVSGVIAREGDRASAQYDSISINHD